VFRKKFSNIIILIIIFTLSIFKVGSTYAISFDNSENSNSNKLEAGTLDMIVTSSDNSFIPAGSMNKGETVIRDLYVENHGTTAFDYRFSYEYQSGYQPLCDAFEVTVKYNGIDEVYSDLLKNFVYQSPVVVNPGTNHFYKFEVKLPLSVSDELSVRECIFNIKTVSWQDNFLNEDQGFWDEETIENSLTSIDWIAPVSNVLILEADYNIQPVEVPFNSTDNASNITEVSLWYRFEGGAWTLFQTLTSGDFTPALTVNDKFSFTFPDGEGKYEFYSIAKDSIGNTENVSSLPDTETIYDITVPQTTISYTNYLKDYELLQEFFVSAKGTVISSLTLETDKDYLIEVSGTFFAGGNTAQDIEADAEYSQDDYQAVNNLPWTDLVRNYEVYGEGLLELRIDNDFVEWGDYNPEHKYLLPIVGEGSSLAFDINDTYPDNNTGDLKVRIYEQLHVDEDTEFTLSAVDDNGLLTVSGIKDISYNIDGSSDVIYSGSFNLSALGLTDGLHFIEYFSEDKAGNIEVNERLYFIFEGQKEVIINEIMWMGSSISTADEWIELRNLEEQEVDLSGWILENAGASGSDLIIPDGSVIPANGYFLITNYSATNLNSALNTEGDWVTTSLSLLDSGEKLELINNWDRKIDETPSAPWPAGNSSLNQSMSRVSIPGDGLLSINWYTCVSTNANGSPYWDEEDENFGTPKGENE